MPNFRMHVAINEDSEFESAGEAAIQGVCCAPSPTSELIDLEELK
jgi:hypothetical protein